MPGDDDRTQDTTVDASDTNSEEQTEQQAEGQDESADGPAEPAAPDAPDDVSDAGATAAETNEDDLESLKARVRELEEENSSLKDQYLRKQAEFENFRKRMTKEKADAISYANQQLLQDVIQIIDDFERAIRSSEESRDFDAFHDGVAMIEKQFVSMLERKWGLTRFDSEGEEFDPQKHEAVTTEEVEGEETTHVLEEYQKGYFLHDRVLRSAKVKVSVPKSSEG
jgi:molecular chaperone GrpE